MQKRPGPLTRPRPLTVALTGNVASGKSTVARLFRGWGAVVTDADAVVRELQRPGTPVFQAIVGYFGVEVLAPDGTLNRGLLRRRILADPDQRRALEAIVHPAVQARRAELQDRAAAAGAEIVVHDIPLLFEAADPAMFDLVVLVDAPAEVRRRRLLDHRGLAPEEADRLMATQIPAEQKRLRSDIVIENDADLAALDDRARSAWDRIRRTAAARA